MVVDAEKPPCGGPSDGLLSGMMLSQPQVTTRRLYRQLKHRPVHFTSMRATAGLTISETCRKWPDTRIVFVLGDAPADWLTWAAGDLPGFWNMGSHYLDGNTPILRYKTPNGAIEVHQAAEWFGEGNYSVGDAAKAYEALQGILAATFDGATVLATPATTGRECFLRSIPKGTEYPVLPRDVQDLIRSTDGQGRIEVVRAPVEGPPASRRTTARSLPALYEYDARFAYAAMCWELPCGPVHHDDVDRFEGHMRGRYKVVGHVPRDWPHPFGLIGMKDNAGGWQYPWRKGEPFKTWADASEVHLALTYGWKIHIQERLLFPTASTARRYQLSSESGRASATLQRGLTPGVGRDPARRQRAERVAARTAGAGPTFQALPTSQWDPRSTVAPADSSRQWRGPCTPPDIGRATVHTLESRARVSTRRPLASHRGAPP